jgi:pimeloyl-ACP methyl ester carboxylesterase
MSRRTILLLVVAVIVAMPWIFGGEHETLGDSARRRLPGRFANLKDGQTNFEMQGKAPAELVVFVHGLSSPSWIWGDLPRVVRDAGYATLTYDLYGRGWSDRPWVTYDLDLFVRQLETLLRKSGIRDGSVHVVGLSMGGLISTEFALRNPGAVASLTLLDPAGFAVPDPPGSWILRIPAVGDWIMQVFGNRLLLEGLERSVHDKTLLAGLERRYLPQLEFAGYKRAMLSTLRNMPLSDFRERYAELAKSGIPVELFWGMKDEVTPPEGLDVAIGLLPEAAVHRIEDAGHLAHYEKPAEVAPRIVEFLRATRATVRDEIR